MKNISIYDDNAKTLNELAEGNKTTEAEIIESILDAIYFDFATFEADKYASFNEYMTSVYGLDQ